MPRRNIGLTLPAITVLVLAAGAHATAQKKPYPIFTQDHFVSAMKTVGQAFAAVNAALAKNELEDSKAYLAISRDRLATTITFWRDRQKDDAVKILRDVVTKMDELDAALSIEKVDPTAVSAITKQIGALCQACHSVYREQDPATKAYRVKIGSGQ
jgi:cytochrome c556